MNINEFKEGDDVWEFMYGMSIKTKVKTAPLLEDGMWNMTTEAEDGEEIYYSCSADTPHYGPNIYNYEAYTGCKRVK